MNSGGKEGAAGKIRKAVFEQFADRYLPGPTLDGKVDEKVAAEHAHMMAGVYQVSRRAETMVVNSEEWRIRASSSACSAALMSRTMRICATGTVMDILNLLEGRPCRGPPVTLGSSCPGSLTRPSAPTARR